MNNWQSAGIGRPVGGCGKSPPLPAISRCVYGNGWAESRPCLSKPDARARNAAGNWWPRAVALLAWLLHWSTSAASPWSAINSKSWWTKTD